MQVSKIVVALIAAVGFASASFAQSAAPEVQPAPAVMSPAPDAVVQKAQSPAKKASGKKIAKHNNASKKGAKKVKSIG